MGRPKPKAPTGPVADPEFEEFLNNNRIGEAQKTQLVDFGIQCLDDLMVCEEGDLVDAGLKTFQARKLLRAAKEDALPEELTEDLGNVEEQHEEQYPYSSAEEEQSVVSAPLTPRGVPSSSDVFLSICRRFDSGDGREGIETAFMQVDDDRTGKISFRNLKDIAQQLGENLTDEELQHHIDYGDTDGDGELNVDEFYRVINNARRGQRVM